MGPNGSGKSTLANVIMGRPGYKVTQGKVVFKGEDITRAHARRAGEARTVPGHAVPRRRSPGVSVVNFLRTALPVGEGRRHLRSRIPQAHEGEDGPASASRTPWSNRYVNQGFSGGEKKRNEILQLAVLEPEIAILDETDSGLDIDSLK